MRAMLLMGLIVLSCCRKEVPPAGSPIAPISTAEQDALWRLAPSDTIVGLVASPNAIAMVERYFAADAQVQAAAPELMGEFRELQDQLREKLGTPNPTLAELGLTHDKGFAAFETEGDLQVLIIPVADRDKFIAKMHGTKDDVDMVDGQLCKAIADRYVCVQKLGLFGKLGGAGLDAIRKTAGARGDVEVAARIDTRSSHQSFALAAQLSPGALTVRGVLSGPGERRLLERIGSPSSARAGAATAAGFGMIDLAPYIADLPPLPIAPGVTFAQLGHSIAGPLTFVIGAGAADIGVQIALSDPAPAKTALAHCAEIPPLASAGATVSNGVCHVVIPPVGIELDGWVDGNELRIGSRQEAKPVALAATPLSTEMATSEWAIAVFGRGNFVDLAGASGLTAMLQSSPLGTGLVRVLPLVNEIGLAVRKDGDLLHFLVGIRTAWANPNEVVQKLLAITSEQLLSGKAAEIGASIASAAPDSLFAQDLEAGAGGRLAITVPIGILAALSAVAIPAFMDYTKRPRNEAESDSHRAADLARELARVGGSAERPHDTAGEQGRFDTERRPEKIVEALGIGPGSKVADIGAGSGLLTVHLARAVKPNGRVVATDIDGAVLDLLQLRLAAAGLADLVERRVVSAEQPGLEPASYDAILLAEVDHYFSDEVAWLKDAMRALKPGGRLVISNRLRHRQRALAAAQRAGLKLQSESTPVPTHFIAVFIAGSK